MSCSASFCHRIDEREKVMSENVREPRDPSDVLEAVWRSWRIRDKAAVLALVADDVVYAIYVPNEVLPFGGETVGKAALSDRLQSMIDQFEVLNYDGTIIGTEGDTVRGQVSYRFRHRVTGEEAEGTMRQVVQVRDGLIINFRTYKDFEGVRAFMNVVAHTAADRSKTAID
jgi:ketosteroid isomerase-like protein